MKPTELASAAQNARVTTMGRKKIHNSATDRQKAHVQRQGGRRATFVLSDRSIVALDFLREDMGLSDTKLVNHALVALAAKRLGGSQ